MILASNDTGSPGKTGHSQEISNNFGDLCRDHKMKFHKSQRESLSFCGSIFSLWHKLALLLKTEVGNEADSTLLTSSLIVICHLHIYQAVTYLLGFCLDEYHKAVPLAVRHCLINTDCSIILGALDVGMVSICCNFQSSPCGGNHTYLLTLYLP